MFILTLTTIFYATIGESTFLDGGAKPDSIPIIRQHPSVAVFEARRLSHSDPGCQTVSVLLQSDDYGDEISFKFVYQGTADVVASKPEGSIGSNTFTRFDYSLQGDHCYTFTITDTGYNGICCEFGAGYVQIEIDDTLVFDPAFTSLQESFDFCLDACTTTAEPTTAEPTTAEPTTAEPTTAEPTTAEPTESSDSDSEDVSSGDSDSGEKKRKKKRKKKKEKKRKKKSSGESYSDSGDMALAVVDKLDGDGNADDASLTVSLYWNENQIWILYAMLIVFCGTNGLVFVYVCKKNKNVQVYHDNNEELPSNNI